MIEVVRISVVTALLAACLTAAGCGSESPQSSEIQEPEISNGLPVDSSNKDLPDLTAGWSADGVLGAEEYLGEMVYGNYEIRWFTDEEYVYFGIRAKTDGWVAVGLEPTSGMRDADIIMGFVQDGVASVSDQFSIGVYGPHSTDMELGGTDDIIEFGGREEEGFTTIEFKRFLVTGDEYDKELYGGSVEIIWAYGSADDYTRQNSIRGDGEIDIVLPETQ